MALVNVLTKARKRFGKVYPAQATDYFVEIDEISIKIHKKDKSGNINFCREFIVGQEAEYDSYNLHYTGKIVKITSKAVSIVKYPGTSMAKMHRLDLNEFCWRNWDFDAKKIADYNHNEMMYI